MPSPGTPNIVSTPTSSGIDPPGTPAAPMAVITDMTMTAAIWPSDRSTPKISARKITVMPSKIAVPFMHIVLPIGSTKPAMRCGTPSCSCAMSSAVGSVALLELVENAVISAARMREKNSSGDIPIRNRMIAESVIDDVQRAARSAPSRRTPRRRSAGRSRSVTTR